MAHLEGFLGKSLVSLKKEHDAQITFAKFHLNKPQDWKNVL